MAEYVNAESRWQVPVTILHFFPLTLSLALPPRLSAQDDWQNASADEAGFHWAHGINRDTSGEHGHDHVHADENMDRVRVTVCV